MCVGTGGADPSDNGGINHNDPGAPSRGGSGHAPIPGENPGPGATAPPGLGLPPSSGIINPKPGQGFNDTPTAPATSVAPPPTALAFPNPTMTDPTPENTEAQRLKRLGLLRLGLARTIATSPTGLNTQPAVSAPSLYSPGTAQKLGD